MPNIEMDSVKCGSCNMFGTLDENKLCGLCRPKNTVFEDVQAQIGMRVGLMLMLAVGALVIITWGVFKGINTLPAKAAPVKSQAAQIKD